MPYFVFEEWCFNKEILKPTFTTQKGSQNEPFEEVSKTAFQEQSRSDLNINKLACKITRNRLLLSMLLIASDNLGKPKPILNSTHWNKSNVTYLISETLALLRHIYVCSERTSRYSFVQFIDDAIIYQSVRLQRVLGKKINQFK